MTHLFSKAVGGLFVGVGGLYVGLTQYVSPDSAKAAEAGMHPPKYPWSHRFPWSSFDHHGIRRGFSVYKQVCSTCHSLDRIAFRHLVNVCFTEQEAKALAADVDVSDGPDQEGYMYQRPGKLLDYMPRPYANEQAARFANSGAYPPDLSLTIKAREHHEDYLFALLTGYRTPPHGFKLREGLYYNPYFPGGAIAMPQALTDGQIEYDDGTRATISQMSKDVTTFLCWAAEPEHDIRKRLASKAVFICLLTLFPALYYKRLKWAPLKTRVVSFIK